MNENTERKEPGLSTVQAGKRISIAVAGVGGAGCNFVNRISAMGIRNLTTVAINTDRFHLELVDADKKLLVGKDRLHGTGAGSDPELGRLCMEEASDEVMALLGQPDVLFIVAGLGGGTGTGGAPTVARLAKEAGTFVVGVAFMPFHAERGRSEAARAGLGVFGHCSDVVLVMENDRLLTMAPNMPIDQAFMTLDKIIAESISSMIEMISITAKVVEEKSILDALPQDGLAMVVCGGGKEETAITCEAVDHPLLELECKALNAIATSTARELTEVMVAEARQGAYHMPKANVLVRTRPEPTGSGRKVVPLVAGMKRYSRAVGGMREVAVPGATPRPLRQTVLNGGPWAPPETQ